MNKAGGVIRAESWTISHTFAATFLLRLRPSKMVTETVKGSIETETGAATWNNHKYLN